LNDGHATGRLCASGYAAGSRKLPRLEVTKEEAMLIAPLAVVVGRAIQPELVRRRARRRRI
jgi:hypothetical protein